MPKKYITTSYKSRWRSHRGSTTTRSSGQTQKLGENLAKELLKSGDAGLRRGTGAVVLALQGNLGGGKTTFLQGFAKGLGIKEKILSPTFVIQKRFKIPPVVKNVRSHIFHDGHFYHIDCYRINKPAEILELGFAEIISNPKNIVAVEWPEKIEKVLPKNIMKIDFKFIGKDKREINFSNRPC